MRHLAGAMAVALAAGTMISACARNAGSPAGNPSEVTRVTDPGVTPFIERILNAGDRTIQDRALDDSRRPGELLAFLEVAPGERMGELGAVAGYTTELVARAVGERGQVYAQNGRAVLDNYAAYPWGQRLQKPAMRNVVRVDRELDDPFPTEARDLDAVYIVLFYHEAVAMDADREKMNAAVFRALRSDGRYVIVDHAARKGAAGADAGTLHRIEEALVIAEVERAGFKLRATGEFLRNGSDSRDWSAAPAAAGPRRGTSDRFALQFVKPAAPPAQP
jgi:predicted methyltransferase